MLRRFHSITIVSFSNEVDDDLSLRFLKVSTYFKSRVAESLLNSGLPLVRIGAVGSELECLRYRKQKSLKPFFESFDLILVVTGVLQFAHVLPRISKPIFIQCATRLKWERESQYPDMRFFRKLILKMQIPVFFLQERSVLRQKANFLPENAVMVKWLKSHSQNTVDLWYPGTASLENEENSQYRLGYGSHFISVGRFNEPRKGWHRLFKAYSDAYQRNSLIPKLVVIGWGEFSEGDSKVLQEVQISCPIEVLGGLSNEVRDLWLRESTYFLQTSHEEGLGLAALEALRFGKPIISSDTDGSREYVQDGITGKIVLQTDDFVQRFADQILASQHWDYWAMSNNSRVLFDNQFSESSSLKRLNEIFSEHGIS
jgi:glycosyltransferase involved in cell wall biosynthesis